MPPVTAPNVTDPFEPPHVGLTVLTAIADIPPEEVRVTVEELWHPEAFVAVTVYEPAERPVALLAVEELGDQAYVYVPAGDGVIVIEPFDWPHEG